jgi:hypothetical protein
MVQNMGVGWKLSKGRCEKRKGRGKVGQRGGQNGKRRKRGKESKGGRKAEKRRQRKKRSRGGKKELLTEGPGKARVGRSP